MPWKGAAKSRLFHLVFQQISRGSIKAAVDKSFFILRRAQKYRQISLGLQAAKLRDVGT